MKTIKLVSEFKISLREWLRGEGAEVSRLYRRRDNKKCCMGIYAMACGVSKSKLIGKGTLHTREAPLHAIFNLPAAFSSLCGQTSSYLLDDIYKVNDDPNITNTIRKKKLKQLFKRAKIRVKFVR